MGKNVNYFVEKGWGGMSDQRIGGVDEIARSESASSECASASRVGVADSDRRRRRGGG